MLTLGLSVWGKEIHAQSPSVDKPTYDRDGFITIRQAFNASEAALLAQWVEEVSRFPPSEDAWMHHYEQTPEGPRLSRTEAFVSSHPQLGRRLMAGRIPELVGQALGEPVFLYKEKINYKYPGGAGYNAHQDAPAYKQVGLHATALVAIERATAENGCLEFAAGRHEEGLIGLTEDGVLSKEAEAGLTFTPCEMEPGDVTIFSSYIPHRSAGNPSPHRPPPHGASQPRTRQSARPRSCFLPTRAGVGRGRPHAALPDVQRAGRGLPAGRAAGGHRRLPGSATPPHGGSQGPGRSCLPRSAAGACLEPAGWSRELASGRPKI